MQNALAQYVIVKLNLHCVVQPVAEDHINSYHQLSRVIYDLVIVWCLEMEN